MQAILRSYSKNDRDSCRALWKELVEWHREIYEDQTIGGDHPEDYFDKYLVNHGSDRFWVAVVDSIVVGIVGLVLSDYEVIIEPLVVSEKFRRKGIGRQLVQKAVLEAHNMGITSLSVAPVARNAFAIKFFHSLGFKNLGHVDLFIDFSTRKWKRSLEIDGCQFNF